MPSWCERTHVRTHESETAHAHDARELACRRMDHTHEPRKADRGVMVLLARIPLLPTGFGLNFNNNFGLKVDDKFSCPIRAASTITPYIQFQVSSTITQYYYEHHNAIL